MQGNAVLIFADLLAADLARRGWSRRLSSLLAIPALDRQAIGADVHLFTPSGRPAGGISGKRGDEQYCVHRQVGRSFGERLENAVGQLAGMGYDKIVIVGRDCPELTQGDIAGALESLDSHRLVLGPDHKGGCYLIALHAADRGVLAGIRWRRNTDCAALEERMRGAGRVAFLEMRVDVDAASDVRRIRWLRHLVDGASELLAVACQRPISLTFLRECRRWQLPPPMIAA